ncbi:MAG: ATP-dependent DNA helicase RecG [Pseudomonadota bacterium]
MRPSILNALFRDTTSLTGVGPKVAALINKVAGPRLVNLILTPPAGLIDRSFRPKIAEAKAGGLATMLVQIDRHEPAPNRRQPYRVICSDETGFLTLVFFHARTDYLNRTLPEGQKRLISGRLEEFGGGRQMTHPDHIVDPARSDDLPLFEPVYPLTAGLSGAVMRKAVTQAVTQIPTLAEWQDESWLAKNTWPSWQEAVTTLHAPQSDTDLGLQTKHRLRLAYDEFLANQLALALIRRDRVKVKGIAQTGRGVLRAQAKKALPFALTNAQEQALGDIFEDMANPSRMVRLLQGDVGSGKTVVALMAMLTAVEAGNQAVLMAPTEILARQHLEGLEPICTQLKIVIEVLTGRDKGKARTQKLAALARGDIHILLGTHAVFQETVAFNQLGLVVVDEQHRFGVHQRMALTEKGAAPDLLVMTATPIPRTLALTAYGDMDVSIIAEKPPGRKPVTTRTLPMERIDDVVDALRRALTKGDQVYWVCPLVEESDVIELTAAQDRYETLRTALGPEWGRTVGLVHGKMKAAEKDAVMTNFHEGKINVLVATTVIEVGVNAPNATVMVIEHAERFGLAQLHQLRGRVGRGEKPSTCLLLYRGPLGETAKARLSILRESEDGFRLAEEDLRLRGAGDVLGTAQSGFPRFALADMVAHSDYLLAAGDDAKLILERDPTLASDRGKALLALLYLFGRDDAVKLIRAG